MKINENIAYAKSILNKNGITQDSPEYQDYLKIREICGNNTNYVGILTKLRIIDGVTDMNEIKSILDILKNSKIEIYKLNKLSYDEILEIFYDELSGEKEKNKDIELIYKDSEYSYYRVYTYEGILKIGSPAWCIKTKANWNNYLEKYDQQWVVINNKYLNKLLTPNNNYLQEYKSRDSWVRYGVSIKKNDDLTVDWLGFSDNNANMSMDPSSHTFFGVINTIFNLIAGIKKSYYESFRGCELYSDSKDWLRVKNKERFNSRINYREGEGGFKNYKECYVLFSQTYSSTPLMILINDNLIIGLYLTNDKSEIKFANISGKYSKKMINEYAEKSSDKLFSGIKLKLGFTTLEEIEKEKKFIKKIGKWLIFDRNDDYYMIINSELKDYEIPTETMNGIKCYNMNDPVYWYLNKKTKEIYNTKPKPYAEEVIDYLFPKKVKLKGFLDFLKKPKEF